MELLDPKVDFVFKRIFGSEENRDVLLRFLNDALAYPITSISLFNPYIEKDALEDKQSILDIRAVTSEGEHINIEIQLSNRYDMKKRTLYYWAKLYEEQMQEGREYRDLKKTITINILNFNVVTNDQYHNIFHLLEDTTNIMLTDDIEIHFMELPKLEKEDFQLSDRLTRWLLFLKGIERSEWEELAMETPELKKAMTTLEFLSQDKEIRRLYEMRQKALLDERSALGTALREGKVEGMKEGKKERGKEIAIRLLANGMELSKVSELTGLSETELRKLEAQ